jgi:hypothetical protein
MESYSDSNENDQGQMTRVRFKRVWVERFYSSSLIRAVLFEESYSSSLIRALLFGGVFEEF